MISVYVRNLLAANSCRQQQIVHIKLNNVIEIICLQSGGDKYLQNKCQVLAASICNLRSAFKERLSARYALMYACLFILPDGQFDSNALLLSYFATSFEQFRVVSYAFEQYFAHFCISTYISVRIYIYILECVCTELILYAFHKKWTVWFTSYVQKMKLKVEQKDITMLWYAAEVRTYKQTYVHMYLKALDQATS